MKIVPASIVLLQCCLMGQIPTSGDRNSMKRFELRKALLNLGSAMTLDKDSYLPGEEVKVHISIQNKSEHSVDVYNPFLLGYGAFTLRGPGFNPMASIEGMGSNSVFANRPIEPSEVLHLASGQKLELHVESSSNLGLPFAPGDPGSYELTFAAFQLKSAFSVRDARVLLVAEENAPLGREQAAKEAIFKARNLRRPFPPSTADNRKFVERVFSVLDGDQYKLCIQSYSRPSIMSDSRFASELKSEGRLSKLLPYLGPFRCIETSAVPFADVEMTFGNDDSMLVIAKRERSSMVRIRLNASNKQIP